MSFNTKFSMWWGSVTTKTEKMFNKEKQRLVTHEYYDNPNAKTTRPKSMRSIRGSMRVASSRGGDEADDGSRQRRSSRRSVSEQQDDMMSADNYQGGQQQQYPQDMQTMPQGNVYNQQQYMQQQPMQGYPNQGYANQGYGQGYGQGY